MTLITTPTGDIGQRVLKDLLNAGVTLRVIVRDTSRLPDGLRVRVDVIEGSHADAAAIGSARHDTDRVFWMSPGDPTKPSAEAAYGAFSRLFAEALAGSGLPAAASKRLLSPDWEGVEESPLQGHGDLSFDETALILSQGLRRLVVFHEMSMDALAEMRRSMATSEGMTRDDVDTMTAKTEGMDSMRRDAPRQDVPATFRAWAKTDLKPAIEAASASPISEHFAYGC